jgi:hypothetical protein
MAAKSRPLAERVLSRFLAACLARQVGRRKTRAAASARSVERDKFMTTITQDINSIILTPTAIAKAQAAGADLPALMTQLQLHITEKQRLIKEIIRMHPVGGGDVANLASLNAILAKL